jgi:hypothetical protein
VIVNQQAGTRVDEVAAGIYRISTLLCGDLFTQPGATLPPVTEPEVLTASEGMRGMMEYYAHATRTSQIPERLAELGPSMLACQLGSRGS